MLARRDHHAAQPPSASEITEYLIQLVDDVAGIRIDRDTGLLASGLTSANLAALTAGAAARWNVDIPVEVYFGRGTVASVADFVHATLSAPPARQGNTAPVSDRRAGSAAERKNLRNQIRAAVGKIR
ncbi:hypothetical protein BLA60_04795 [Actinophytocola xinjiangensis]|uniref:Carrier domain-containing protein n=1 Tax=Actinophytocola xinjiangensis TaxID=485602 RepID=A0A7Z1B0B1_9PSEU|nr:phosphopantetheine-binding protein [Actinophytocola xinjiangensis]OLF14439.1 hypothetical protein BLA60_04795 [Actinophytocola xinjiangensis]